MAPRDDTVPAAGRWLYQRFVRCLVASEHDDPEIGLRAGLSANLPNRRKPGTRMRIGLGSALLVTTGGVVVAADVVPARQWPEVGANWSLDWQALDQRSAYAMLTDLILDPPEPPFLFVQFGKNPSISGSLRLSVSRDVLEVCGEGARTIRRRPVMQAFGRLNGVPAEVFRRAAGLAHRRARDPRSRQVQSAIERLLAQKGEAAKRAIASAAEVPRLNTPEFEALSRLMSARDKGNIDGA